MKEYFKRAGLLFLAFLLVAALFAGALGGGWLAVWLWVNVHPAVGALVALAVASLVLAAMTLDHGWGWV